MTTYTADFTLDDVANKVLEVADERPDFIYTSQVDGAEDILGCSYLHGPTALIRDPETEDWITAPLGEQRCIVGEALHRLGVPDEFLVKHEDMTALSLILRLVPDDGSDSDRYLKLCEAINAAQSRQDEGTPWGEAVASLRALVDD